MKKGGEIVFEDLWRIYRQDAGMGKFEYGVFHNGEFFASAPSMVRAERIIEAIQREARP